MIHIKETCVDKNLDCTYGDSEVYETFTDSVGELFSDKGRLGQYKEDVIETWEAQEKGETK